MFEISTLIITFGFCSSCLINFLLIYLTIFHVTCIKGTYKSMTVTFAVLCIVFDTAEVLSRPSLHNFNGSLMYFSLNQNPANFGIVFYQWFIIIYGGLYTSIIAFVAVQFIFRYSCIIRHNYLLSSFEGCTSIIWFCFVIIPGIVFCVLCKTLVEPDVYSDNYIREEVLRVYSRQIEDVPRLLMVPYDNKNRIRWNNYMFSISEVVTMSFEYLIIFFCAFNMHRNIRKKLKTLSFRSRVLENQFFRALLVQISLPTVFLTLPFLPIITLPLLDIKISFHSAAFYSKPTN